MLKHSTDCLLDGFADWPNNIMCLYRVSFMSDDAFEKQFSICGMNQILVSILASDDYESMIIKMKWSLYHMPLNAFQCMFLSFKAVRFLPSLKA